MKTENDHITELLCDWMNLSAEQYESLFSQLQKEYLTHNKVRNAERVAATKLFRAHYHNHVKRINEEFFERISPDQNLLLWYRTKEGSEQVISLTTPKEVEERYVLLHYQKLKASWSNASLMNILSQINPEGE